MRLVKMRVAQVMTLMFALGVTMLPAAEKAAKEPGEEKGADFKFSKVDLSLLEQADALDRKLEREGMVYHDEAMETYVNQVGRAMLPAGSAPERVMWQFRTVRDPLANAFALPNGSIYVTTGLVAKLENEDQLAGVLAHEMTHVTDRHAYLAFRDYRKKSMIANIAVTAASVAPGGSSWGDLIILAGSIIPVMMVASIEGYSRELERDADMYAFNKMVEGNYDPKELVNTFRLLEQNEEANVGKIYYNDHPKLEDRIAYMTSMISSKPAVVVPADVFAARRMKYLTLTSQVAREDIHLAILSSRPRTALARAQKLLDFQPNSAENLCAEADAYRALGPWTPKPSDQELTKHEEKKEMKMKMKFTDDEEERKLLAGDQGQTVWRDNQKSAEENYKKALAVDPGNAKSYLGLGQLYDKTNRNQEALAAYQKYLELAPNALDRQRVQGRINALSGSANR
jgi:beta-barrel assembly-enhancing protease